MREMSWALQQTAISPIQKFVLLAIGDNADGDGTSVCRSSTISRYTNLSEAEADAVVSELVSLGLLASYPEHTYLLACGPDEDSVNQFGFRKKPISQSMRLRVFQRDGKACLRCGCDDLTKLRADHVVPESKGGEATLDNLQALCEPCNTWKGVKTIDFRKEVAL
jgi:hypothetical protein